MKTTNPKFVGINQITSDEVKRSILNYFPTKDKLLTSFKQTTTLEDLIDFCIFDYGAWKDAVLMGAGAYLKIGNYPDEIAEAKEYVKKEVYNYLTTSPFTNAEDYDAWHKKICCTLSDSSTYFQNYSKYRKSSKDNFKNKIGFTFGNAQKFLNMLMKDLYACLSQNSSFLNDYEKYFTYCHMPLDSYILRFIDDIRNRENIEKSMRTWGWSNLTSYDDYIDEQKDIRNYVEKYNPKITVLQTEFLVWPLYK